MGFRLHHVPRSICQEQFHPAGLRGERSQLLRQLQQRRRVWNVVATLLYGGWLESIHGRGLVVLPRDGLHVGVGISVGLDALLLRELALRAWFRLGLAAGWIQ